MCQPRARLRVCRLCECKSTCDTYTYCHYIILSPKMQALLNKLLRFYNLSHSQHIPLAIFHTQIWPVFA